MTFLSNLTYFIVDVDGTMTDSGLFFDDSENELKRFSSKDYAGIMAAHYVGIKILIVTGRECAATARRAKELKVDFLYQRVKDKKEFIQKFMNEHGLKKENIGYIGDDLNDLAAMDLAGFIACPSDACVEIMEKSDYVSPIKGGQGVIQDVFRWVLSNLRKWDSFIDEVVSKGY